MTRKRPQRSRSRLGAARLMMGAVTVLGATGAFGCLQRPVEPVEPRTTSTIVERINQSSVDKIDLVLAIDNSASMADKQAILAEAVPDLVKGLLNPLCISTSDADPLDVGPLGTCPDGFEREFDPVLDVHIGIISSSIGGYGGDGCSKSLSASNNDHGRLLARSSAGGTAENDLAPKTYEGKLFLAWDPEQKKVPPAQVSNPGDGEADLEVPSDKDLNDTALIPMLTDMVIGVGQEGCGFEASLESWYRFLVDPEPYATLTVVDRVATPQGLDDELLRQRADFLRPDSLLAIIMLTDENDCSIREGSQYYLAATYSNNYRLPKARTECATNPNDPCCFSCGQKKAECPADPACFPGGDDTKDPLPHSVDDDRPNLRCFDQKRRFGIDFLYPVSRYTDALTRVQVQNRKGEMVPNPIFSNLSGKPGNIRDPGLVFFAGIVGVPWQDIARDPADLKKGFKSSDELNEKVGSLGNTWEAILGDPANYVPPADPFMRESIVPRSGSNPITGDAIVQGSDPQDPNTYNQINGTEWSTNNDDLQFACIFPLKASTPCPPGAQGCDCNKSPNIPLCTGPGGGKTQEYAKAYPGLRPLQLIKSIGSQGIVGSVCPAQLTEPLETDFGYRPAIGAIIERLKQALGGQCLPRSLVPDKDGQVSCLIIEARNSQGACSCDPATGRNVTLDENKAAERAIAEDPFAKESGWDCFCEITQLRGDALGVCQNDEREDPRGPDGQLINGWCYVDATTTPPLGNVNLVAGCDVTQKRLIRFVGEAESASGATTFITCAGEPGQN
ncbi:hypothetical protein [Chondromyces crocatus]|uniref:Uncharacterized protein n=1 Tax=Chondromyces crocatus TaxID=52 RepID=A0A0K1E578_CHOCO|nr:hypothetical protein [Chondromyces crocatus]AKT36004.1 uncharacterized protein CMC5_001160 [Chondromyces crocatus]